MEPLRPLDRQALKAAHANVTDAVLDQLDALLAQRFLLDPEKELEKIKELDRVRIELIQKEVPNFEDVLRKARND